MNLTKFDKLKVYLFKKGVIRTRGNLTSAAEWIGINRNTIFNWMHRYGLKSFVERVKDRAAGIVE